MLWNRKSFSGIRRSISGNNKNLTRFIHSSLFILHTSSDSWILLKHQKFTLMVHMSASTSGHLGCVSNPSSTSRPVSPNSGLVHYFSMITDPHGHMPAPAHTGPALTEDNRWIPGRYPAASAAATVHYSMWNSGSLEVRYHSLMYPSFRVVLQKFGNIPFLTALSLTHFFLISSPLKFMVHLKNILTFIFIVFFTIDFFNQNANSKTKCPKIITTRDPLKVSVFLFDRHFYQN